MKQKLSLLLLVIALLTPIKLSAGIDDKINKDDYKDNLEYTPRYYLRDETFPDRAFRHYLDYTYFLEDDIVLTALYPWNIYNVKTINIVGLGVKSLKDMELFTELGWLFLDNNPLKELIISHENRQVIELHARSTLLTRVDVSELLDLQILDLGTNNLREIDLSHNEQLEKLKIDDNALRNVDISKNSLLTNLSVKKNLLTDLDLSHQKNLETLDCGNNDISNLDLSNQGNSLRKLYASHNKLTSLDLKNNTQLTELQCSYNQLTSLDLSGRDVTLDCTGNERKLPFNYYIKPNGTRQYYMPIDNSESNPLYAEGFRIENVSDWQNVKVTNILGQPVIILQDDRYPIEYDYDTHNINESMRTVHFSIKVDIENSQPAPVIDSTTFPDPCFREYVQKLSSASNSILSNADIANATTIDVSGLSIKSLKGIEYLTYLTDLNCSNNQLTELDLNNNKKLRTLYCSHNQLSSLKTENCTELTELECTHNQLQDIDVNNCPNLRKLKCSNNQLINVNLVNNPVLWSFECNDNVRPVELQTYFSTELGKKYYIDIDMQDPTSLLYSEGLDMGQALELTNASLKESIKKGQYLEIENVKRPVTYKHPTGSQSLNNGYVSYTLTFTTTAASEYDPLLIPIDSINFPDDNFRDCVKTLPGADDGFFSKDEINDITIIDCRYKSIKDLTGIKYFTNLNRLFCTDNLLTMVDVSENTKLTKLYIGNNPLTCIDVEFLPQLVELDNVVGATTLHVNANYYVDKNGQKNYYIPIENDEYNPLNQYGFNNTDISDVRNGRIEVINGKKILVTSNENQTVIYKYNTRNPNLANPLREFAVTFDTNNAEEMVFIDETKFPDENFRKVLSELPQAKNETLSSADIKSLYRLDCNKKSIKDLTGIQYFTGLVMLLCEDNPLTRLDVSKNVNLEMLNCSRTQICALDLTNNKKLTTLYANEIRRPIKKGHDQFDGENWTAYFYLKSGQVDLSGRDAESELEDDGFIDTRVISWTNLYTINLSRAIIDDISKPVTYKYNTGLPDMPITVTLDYVIRSAEDLSDDYRNGYGSLSLDARSFPDEVFRKYIIEEENNGSASPSEELRMLNHIQILDDSKRTEFITDFTGLCFFSEVEIFIAQNERMKSVNFTRNPKIRYINANNSILFESFDASNCTELEILSLQNCNFSNLDVSQFKKLNTLYCSGNPMTSIDLSKNQSLTDVIIQDNKLNSLDVSNNSDLKYLECSGGYLTCIDLGNNAKLESADFSKGKRPIPMQYFMENNKRNYFMIIEDNDLNPLYADGFTVEKASDWNNAKVMTKYGKTILLIDDVTKPIEYKYDTNCPVSTFKTMDFAFCVDTIQSCEVTFVCEDAFPDDNFRAYVKTLKGAEEEILSYEELGWIEEIDCHGMHIKNLKGIEKFRNLHRLDCSENEINELSFGKGSQLRTLDCSNNQLESLDVTGAPGLTDLLCNNNNLSVLDLSQNSQLSFLNCSDNHIKSLPTTSNKELVELWCSNNNIRSMNLLQNDDLRVLKYSNNEMSSIDLSGCVSLQELESANNERTVPAYYYKNGAQKVYYTFLDNDTTNVLYNDGFDFDCASSFTNGDTDTFLDNPVFLFTNPSSPATYTYATRCLNNTLRAVTFSIKVDTENSVELDPRYIAINKENFPDDKFREYLKTLPEGADGQLDDNDIDNMQTLNCSNMQISNLKGIEFFANLKDLNCADNNLYRIDLSKNLLLEKLNCSNNHLMGLDLSNNGKMTSLTADGNSITVADYYYNDYDNFYLKTGLKRQDYLIVDSLSTLNVLLENEVDLERILQWENAKPLLYEQRPTIRIINNTKPVLYSYDTGLNGMAYEATININTAMAEEYLPLISDIFPDAAFRDALNDMSQQKNRLLTKEEVVSVKSLKINSTSIRNMDGIRFFFNLDTLDCSNNALDMLNISEIEYLKVLNCSNNKLQNLDLSKNIYLTKLDCSRNKIYVIDLSPLVMLTDLNCSYNNLCAIDLSRNENLTTIDCSNNVREVYDFYSARSYLGCFTLIEGKKSTLVTDGFDMTKASGWNAQFLDNVYANNEDVLKFDDYFGDRMVAVPSKKYVINYDYDTKLNGLKVPLKLVFAGDGKNVAQMEGIPLDEEHFPSEPIRHFASNNFDKNKDNKLDYIEIKNGKRFWGNGINNWQGMENLTGVTHLTTGLIFEADSIIDLRPLKNLEIVGIVQGNAHGFIFSGLKKLKYIKLEKLNAEWIDVRGCENLDTLILKENNLVCLDLSSCYNIKSVSLTDNHTRKVKGFSYLDHDKLQYGAVINDSPESSFRNHCFDFNKCSNMVNGQYGYDDGEDHSLDKYIDFSDPQHPGAYHLFRFFDKTKPVTYTYDCGLNYKFDFSFELDEEQLEYAVPLRYYMFKDDSFLKYVFSELPEAKDGIIYSKELEGLTSIDCSNRDIYDLSGLEYFKHLQSLNCKGNHLLDIDLSALTELDNLEGGSQTVCLKPNYFMQNGEKVYYLNLDKDFGYPLYTGGAFDANKVTFKPDMVEAVTFNGKTVYVIKPNITHVEYDYHSGAPNIISSPCIHTTLEIDYANATERIPYDIEINEENFPDKTFREYVVRKLPGAEDGVLSGEELLNITSIDCNFENIRDNNPSLISDDAIRDLKGIEFFSKMSTLDCSNNHLTSLDLSKNTALTTLDCSYNSLTSLDLSANTALTELYCSQNNLTSLDLSKNTALTTLKCNSNQLTSLDLKANTALKQLICWKNQLKSLDLSANTKLKTLYCNNNQLTSLDVSGCTELCLLACENNQLTSLDVSGYTALNALSCGYNQLTSLDVSGCTELTVFDCTRNKRDVAVNFKYEKDGKTYYYIDMAADERDGIMSGDEFHNKLGEGFSVENVISWTGATVGETPAGKKALILEGQPTSITYVYNTLMAPRSRAVNGNMDVTLNLKYDVTTTVGDIDKDSAVRIFSTAGEIRIKGSEAEVRVFDMSGRCVYAGLDREVAVSAGIYIVKIGGITKKITVR